MSSIDQRSIAQYKNEFPEIAFIHSTPLTGGWRHVIELAYASENNRTALSLVLECVSLVNQFDLRTLPGSILPLCQGFERAMDERGIPFAKWVGLPGPERGLTPDSALRKALKQLNTWQLSVAISSQEALGSVNESYSQRQRLEINSQRPRFKIIAETPPYAPEEGTLPSFSIEEGESSFMQGSTSSNAVLYITREARADLFDHIGFGNPGPENRMEQGGILVGRVICDPRKREMAAIVESVFPGTGAVASPTSLELGTEVWASMLARLETQSKANQASHQIIGWYHTHPGSLDVFMSGVDMDTQRRLFPRDWQFAVVLNPHQRRWRVFQGAKAVECPGHFLQEPSSSQPKTTSQTTRERISTQQHPPQPANKMAGTGASSSARDRNWILKNALVFATLIFLILLLLKLAFPEQNPEQPEKYKGSRGTPSIKRLGSIDKLCQEQVYRWYGDPTNEHLTKLCTCLKDLRSKTP